MADDKVPENYQSDDEMYLKEEDANDNSGRSSRVSPPKTAGPHSVLSATSNGHSPAANLQGTPFMADIPVRGSQYSTAAMMAPDLTTGQHPYVEGGTMAVGTQPSLPTHSSMHHIQEMVSHDSGRRPSLYNQPGTEYPNSSGPGLFPWPQTFASQHPQPQPSTFVGQPGVSLSQGSQYLGPPFAGLPHPDIFRNGTVGQNPTEHGSGYPNYVGHDGRPIPHGLKMEPPTRGPLH